MVFPTATGCRFLSFLLAGCLTAESVVVDNKGLEKPSLLELAQAKLQPGIVHRVEEATPLQAQQAQRLSPVNYEFYRFSVARGSIEVGDLFLYNEDFSPLDLKDPQTVLQVRLGGPEVLPSSGDVGPCVDGAQETLCHLEPGQNIVLKLAPGRPVGAYGFTVLNGSGTWADPVDFSLAGSVDGSSWKNLSVKSNVEMPKGDAIMVGPYMVLDLTAPASVPGVTGSSIGGAIRWAKETHPAKVAESVPMPFSAQPKVHEETTKAPSTSTTPKPPETTPEAIVEEAQDAGLPSAMLKRIRSSLETVDCKYYKAIKSMWHSASRARMTGASIARKVAQVVAISADAGFTVEQQAEAGAAAARAALSGTHEAEGPADTMAEALQSLETLGMDLAKQTEMAAVMETQSPEERRALLMLLRAASPPSTTMAPPRRLTNPEGSNESTAASAPRVVAERISEALEGIQNVDPQVKVQVISGGAAAAQPHAA